MSPGTTSSRVDYYSDPGGEEFGTSGDGVLYPLDTITPAIIGLHTTSITPSTGCTGTTSPCTIYWEAKQLGFWHAANEEVHRFIATYADTVSSNVSECTASNSLGCIGNDMDWPFPLSSETTCGATATGTTTHTAWWTKVLVGGAPTQPATSHTGVYGLTSLTSVGPHAQLPTCPEYGGGGGGEGGGEDCYEVWLVWYDEFNNITEADDLGGYCCDSMFGCRAE